MFSEVIVTTPIAPSVRLPEYFGKDHSKPPTLKLPDHPIRDHGLTNYDPQTDPRFPILTECRSLNNEKISHERKETEYKRQQNTSLELIFAVRVKFQGLYPHPVF